MRNTGTALVVLVAVLATALPAGGQTDRPRFGMGPVLRGGDRWRIGYYEGGPHDNYFDCFAATIAGLMDLGWLEPREIPFREEKDTAALWRWLATEVPSKYLEFSRNAYHSALWDERRRRVLRGALTERLRGVRDIDVMIAMGTWAGQDLANDLHHTPTLVMAAADPVGWGIVDSAEDSGRDHVHAHITPDPCERQVRVFHDLVGFRRLGIAYEDSATARARTAIAHVEKVARERGFEVLRCDTRQEGADRVAADGGVKECFRELVGSSDAVYVMAQSGVNRSNLPELVRIANEHRVPTFSQAGSWEVEDGILFGISRTNYKPVGLFLAATLAQVMNGAVPRELNQRFEEPLHLAVNLKTAEVAGIAASTDLLAAADELYTAIPSPQ